MNYLSTLLACFLLFACSAQQHDGLPKKYEEEYGLIGGPFENREVFFEGMPTNINAVDTSLAWKSGGYRLVIKGQILKRDGQTPVPNTVLYYYHTNEDGYYAGMKPHGDIRGWVKSDEAGNYEIYTSRPAPYPNRGESAHIHLSVLEPGISYPYYIDEIVFDDDVLLNTAKRRSLENRGGSGIVRLEQRDGYKFAEHDILLGLNIPSHPEASNDKVNSGPEIGEDLVSFNPFHVWGPDRKSRACPICKYGRYTGILFFGNLQRNRQQFVDYLLFLEEVGEEFQEEIKVFAFDFGQASELEELGMLLNLKHLSLGIIEKKEADKIEIDADLANTIIIYKKSRVVGKFIDSSLNDELKSSIFSRIENEIKP
jgi:protocatechuate 3,4-dioxygenase beta subunit